MLVFSLKKNLRTLDSGLYEVIRLIDKDRVLIRINNQYTKPRRLMIIRKKEGKLLWSKQESLSF